MNAANNANNISNTILKLLLVRHDDRALTTTNKLEQHVVLIQCMPLEMDIPGAYSFTVLFYLLANSRLLSFGAY